jgi:hypothetical protein
MEKTQAELEAGNAKRLYEMQVEPSEYKMESSLRAQEVVELPVNERAVEVP